MLRRLVIALSLLAVGCHAQSAPPANLNLRIEQQVRSTLQVPPYVKIAVGQRSPSEFTGYDNLKVTLSLGQKTKDLDFLISKDNKTLMSVSKIDLTKDPYADIMNKIDIKGRPYRGNKDAKVLVVVYADYQCPFCRRHAQQVLPELLKNYVDTGKLKFVMKEFPIPNLHPQAEGASQAALCAQDQGKYWEMHDRLFGNQQALDEKGLEASAQALGLDTKLFQQCLDTGKYKAEITDEIKVGTSLGVTGTPTFFLGPSGTDPNNFRATKKIGGAFPYTAFKQAIDEIISPPKAASDAKAAAKPGEAPAQKPAEPAKSGD